MAKAFATWVEKTEDQLVKTGHPGGLRFDCARDQGLEDEVCTTVRKLGPDGNSWFWARWPIRNPGAAQFLALVLLDEPRCDLFTKGAVAQPHCEGQPTGVHCTDCLAERHWRVATDTLAGGNVATVLAQTKAAMEAFGLLKAGERSPVCSVRIRGDAPPDYRQRLQRECERCQTFAQLFDALPQGSVKLDLYQPGGPNPRLLAWTFSGPERAAHGCMQTTSTAHRMVQFPAGAAPLKIELILGTEKKPQPEDLQANGTK